MKHSVSVHWGRTIEEHEKTDHVLSVSNLLALSRQCTPVLVADAFERWITQVPGKGAPMTRGGFVRTQMGRERGLSRI